MELTEIGRAEHHDKTEIDSIWCDVKKQFNAKVFESPYEAIDWFDIHWKGVLYDNVLIYVYI